jgi:hypothetical protein
MSEQKTTAIPSARRRFGFYFGMAILMAACLQGVFYLLVLDNTVGPFSLGSLFARDATPSVAGVRAAIVVSRATARITPAHLMEADQWESFFSMHQIPYERVREEDLGTALPDVLVLVLPDLSCISKASRTALMRHLERGRSLIASGPVGTRDEQGAWLGWDFLMQIADLQNPHMEPSGDPAFLSFRSDGVFSASLPGGYRLSLESQPVTLANARMTDAYISNWKLRPQGDETAGLSIASHAYHGNGRVVWFGFNPGRHALTDTPGLVMSPLQWTAKQSVAVKANWPNGNAAAVIFAQKVVGDPADSVSSIRLLQSQGVPSTLLVSGTGAAPEAIRSSGGLDLAWSGEGDRSLMGLPESLQSAALLLGRRRTEQWIGRPVYGGATPFGLTNLETAAALNTAGYRYYLEEINVTRAVPELMEFPVSILFPFQKSYVARIPVTGTTDFDAVAHFDKPDAADLALTETFIKDADRVSYLGGVYTVPMSSYLLGSQRYQPVLRELIRNIKEGHFWFTTAADVAQWWIARHNIEVDLEQIGPKRFQLGITNRGSTDADGFSVRIYVPFPPTNFEVRPALLQLHPATARRVPGEDAVDVLFPRLSAQTYYSFMLQLN